MNRGKWLVSFLATCLSVATLPNFVDAASVKIDNVANDDIFVAIAYRFWKGDVACEGWFKIESNKSMTFTAEDGSDMYIRVIKQGKEVRWTKYNAFRSWPVHPTERFTVSKSPLNDKVDIYRWGANLGNDDNVKRGDPIPKGFENMRFFRIGTGAHGLDVLP